jgi:hypothetical protein
MYLAKVISYGNAWDELNEKYPARLADILKSAEQITTENVRNSKPPSRGFHPQSSNSDLNPWKLEGCWEAEMLAAGWYLTNETVESVMGRRILLRGMGTFFESLSVALIRNREVLNRWLFTLSPIAMRRGLVDLPIAVVMLKGVESSIMERRSAAMSDFVFDRVLDELKELSPLSRVEPFLIFGFDLDTPSEGEVDVVEISSEAEEPAPSIIVNRAIEFPPEYHQAGLGILSYFGEVLREKCPDENARVSIEQDGMTVRLIIQSENGSREVIEKVLQEYQMVVQGIMRPEDLFESKLKVIELKSELRIAQARLETKQDLIEHQRLEIGTLQKLVTLALERSTGPMPTINFAPVIAISNQQTMSFQVKEDFRLATDSIQELSDHARDEPELEMRLRDLEESLLLASKRETLEGVKDSRGLAKLKSLIEEASEKGSSVNSFITKISDGVSIAQKLARRYNDIAEWCGAPTVPRMFIGKDD